MPGNGQGMVLVTIALQVGDLEFRLEYRGFEGHGNFEKVRPIRLQIGGCKE
jgi:hypothetical protein